MIRSMDYYKYFFTTAYSIPIKDLSTTISFESKLKQKPVSILVNYDTEVQNLINDKISKSDSSKLSYFQSISESNTKNLKMKDLSDAFNILCLQQANSDDLNDVNIKKFATIYTLFIHNNNEYIENLDILKRILIGIEKKNLTFTDTPLPFHNPFQIYQYGKESEYILYDKLKFYIEKIPNIDVKKAAISIASNYQLSNYVDLTLPSIGPIYPIYQSYNKYSSLPELFQTQQSIFHFLTYILNGDNNFVDYIPLKDLKIDQVISNLMFKSKRKNNIITNTRVFSDENDRLKNIIESNIQNIQFNLNDVLRDGNKESSKVRNEYILPFRFVGDKLEKLKDLNEIGDRTSAKNVLSKNAQVIAKLLMKNKKHSDFRENPEEEELYKECSAIYLYISITLFYDIYKYYLDKISSIVNEAVEDDRFKKLDLKPVYIFLEKLSKSLYMMKKIYENCFYHLFPSRLTPKYGIKINKDKGYFELENRTSVSIETIYEYYPFVFNSKEKNNKKNTNNNEYYLSETNKDYINKFVNFSLSHKQRQDIFNPNEDLYFGGFIMSSKTTIQFFNEYIQYCDLINIQCKLNKVLTQVLRKSLKNFIPIELFKNMLFYLINHKPDLSLSTYSPEFTDELKENTIDVFKYYLKKSIDSFIILADIRKDIEITGKKKIDLIKYELVSSIYYNKSLVIPYIIKEFVKNGKIMKNMNKNIVSDKKNYEKRVVSQFKNIQVELNEYKRNLQRNRSLNTEILTSNNNRNIQNTLSKKLNQREYRINNDDFYNHLKNILKKDNLFIPYQENGNIQFISVFSVDKTPYNWNRNIINNNSYILIGSTTSDIYDKKKVRVLNSEWINNWREKNIEEKMNLIRMLLEDMNNYINYTEEVLGDNKISKYLEERCQRMNICKDKFISEKQINKIIDIIQKSS